MYVTATKSWATPIQGIVKTSTEVANLLKIFKSY